MAEPTVTLGGKSWKLRYDMNALAELEGALNKPLAKIGADLQRGRMGTREARALTWAAMLYDSEDLSIRLVGDWLTEAGFLRNPEARDALMAKVFEALQSSFPEAAKTDGEANPN